MNLSEIYFLLKYLRYSLLSFITVTKMNVIDNTAINNPITYIL